MCLMDNEITLSQTIKEVLGGASQVGNYKYCRQDLTLLTKGEDYDSI